MGDNLFCVSTKRYLHMLKLDNLKEALEKYRDIVIEEAKKNLLKDDKSASGNLYKSIKATPVKTSKNSLQFNIEMPYYAKFVDKGVSGTRKKYNTPYAYSGRKKMIPPSSLDKWTISRGIAPRDKDGKFMSRQSLKYAIATSVYRNGLKPSLFFTKPFEKYFVEIPEEIKEAFGLDVANFMSFIIKQNQPK